MRFNSNYSHIKTLSDEKKGGVYVALNISEINKDHKTVIIKSYNKNKKILFVNENITNSVIPRELSIIRQISNSEICPVVLDFFETEEMFFIVMEYLTGDWVTLSDYTYNEVEECILKQIFHDIALCLDTLSERKYYYVDIKPDNIMINRDTLKIKLIDFEDVLYFRHLDSLETNKASGTVGYCCPEILERKLSDVRKIQSFAFGSTLFNCLESDTIFFDETDTINFSKLPFTLSSCLAQDLIDKCTCYEPSQRLSLREILNHSWFNI